MEPLMTEAVGRITPRGIRRMAHGSALRRSHRAIPHRSHPSRRQRRCHPQAQLMLERTQFAYRNPKEVF